MAQPRLRLTRAQLASFLKDHQSIKQFETMVDTVNDLNDSGGADQLDWVAGMVGTLTSQISERTARLEHQVNQLLTQATPPSEPVSMDHIDMLMNRWRSRGPMKELDDAYLPSPWDLAYPAWNSADMRWENSVAWSDIDFPIVIRNTGPNIPTLTTVQGNITSPQWAVNDYNVCEGQELIHAWKEGSQVSWHVHMLTNGLDATDRYVKWEVEWFWVNINGAITASTTDTAEILIPANTPTKTMIIGSISQPTLTGGKIGGHVFARLRRISVTTPGRSEPTGNPWCWMLQMHVQCDTLGSRNISSK